MNFKFYKLRINDLIILFSCLQVYVAAIRNRKLELPEDPMELYEINMDKEAAIETEFLPHRDIFRLILKFVTNSLYIHIYQHLI